MMDDFDIDALLEAPPNKNKSEALLKESNGTDEKYRKYKSHKSSYRTGSRSRDKSRKRSQSKNRKHRQKCRFRGRHRSRSRDQHARRGYKNERNRSWSPVKPSRYGPSLLVSSRNKNSQYFHKV
jgi:hypothetical protein